MITSDLSATSSPPLPSSSSSQSKLDATLVHNYFSTLNPIANKISLDINETKLSYEHIWNELNLNEQIDIINETLIKPEISLRYYDSFSSSSSSSSLISLIQDNDNNSTSMHHQHHHPHQQQQLHSSSLLTADAIIPLVIDSGDVSKNDNCNDVNDDGNNLKIFNINKNDIKYSKLLNNGKLNIKNIYSYDGKNLLTYCIQKTGLKMMNDDTFGRFRDEHSIPFSYKTRSQINLRLFTPQTKATTSSSSSTTATASAVTLTEKTKTKSTTTTTAKECYNYNINNCSNNSNKYDGQFLKQLLHNKINTNSGNTSSSSNKAQNQHQQNKSSTLESIDMNFKCDGKYERLINEIKSYNDNMAATTAAAVNKKSNIKDSRNNNDIVDIAKNISSSSSTTITPAPAPTSLSSSSGVSTSNKFLSKFLGKNSLFSSSSSSSSSNAAVASANQALKNISITTSSSSSGIGAGTVITSTTRINNTGTTGTSIISASNIEDNDDCSSTSDIGHNLLLNDDDDEQNLMKNLCYTTTIISNNSNCGLTTSLSIQSSQISDDDDKHKMMIYGESGGDDDDEEDSKLLLKNDDLLLKGKGFDFLNNW